MRIKNHLLNLFLFICLIGGIGCNKFLDKKPDQKLTTPSTLDDLSMLLDNYSQMNGNYPAAGEECADNYYLLDDGWSYTLEVTQNLYLWQKYDNIGADWVTPYKAILNANVIIDNLPHMSLANPSDKKKADQLRAMALFIRAYYHYALSQLFMPVYNKATAEIDLGIPLKLSSDMNEKITRSSSQQTYNCIISDVKNAINSLPSEPDKKYLPSLPAAYGLLSRVYLSMQDYKVAGLYADSALKLYNTLLDYNTVDASSDAPFPQFNDEVIFDSQANYPDALYQPDAKVDSVLFNWYQGNDLRKQCFFTSIGDGSYFFKGNYTGKANNPTMFTGIATDELYLTRAESYARQGDSSKALDDLNTLMSKRINKTDFVPYSLPIENGLLRLILTERRKELLFRALRWTDLRRLNEEAQFRDTLYRFMNGKTYELLPGSNRYTLQIDRNSINISGLIQNP
jgi:starch-binding outer membrane protein, SusD/RagB family